MKRTLTAVMALVAATTLWFGLTPHSQAQTKKPAKLMLIRYNEAADAESGEKAIRAGLTSAGLVDGTDYILTVSSAQNDMPTLINLVDKAVNDKADILIPLQSQSLQPAVQRAPKTPIVFHLVSDPILLGVAKSDTDHLPMVTGAYIKTQPSEFEAVVAQIKFLIPGVTQIGTLYVPGEVISNEQKDLLIEMAAKYKIKVNAVPVDTVSDITNAVQALVSQQPSAIVMIEGSIPNGAFSAVAAQATRSRIPIFGFTAYQAKNGAVFCVVPDVGRGGKAAGEMVSRILKGESPANIPLYRMPSGLKLINSTAARRIGMENISTDTIKGAADVVPGSFAP
ncbi:MAG: hypothetical protein B9S32_06795 [Verrucomicrobia bacterium Tous-C9LFEB]|nr:MAG: hypothetical protein B9S32_06795 [Verrucomicrobia bacterium Tous-C9LFEB]